MKKHQQEAINRIELRHGNRLRAREAACSGIHLTWLGAASAHRQSRTGSAPPAAASDSGQIRSSSRSAVPNVSVKVMGASAAAPAADQLPVSWSEVLERTSVENLGSSMWRPTPATRTATLPLARARCTRTTTPARNGVARGETREGGQAESARWEATGRWVRAAVADRVCDHARLDVRHASA